MNFRLTKPTSSEGGRYNGIASDFQWNTPVDAVYLCPKKKGVIVKGSEFIRLGGLPECFEEERDYIWGCFEECE